MERLRPDKRSPKRPRPRSRSVQRRSSSPQRCEAGPSGRLTPQVELLPPPPSRAGCGAAERRDGPAEQRKSCPPSAQQSRSSAPAHDQFNHVLSNGPSGKKAEKRPRLQVSTTDLPGPEPLKFVNSGCAVLNQDVGGNQMTAAAQGKAQPGASSQRQAELKRPREPSVHGFDNADKQQTRAGSDTASKRAAVQRSADTRIAAQKTAPLLSQLAAPDESQQFEGQEPQSGAIPSAPPVKQLPSPGSAKMQAYRTVPVADNGDGHSWQAAANRDRRVWVDNEAGCAEQIGDEPHLSATAWPSTTQATCSKVFMDTGKIDLVKDRQSSEQQYSTEEYSVFASNPGVDRIIHMGEKPVSLEMNGNPHRHATDPYSMPEETKHGKLSREYPKGLPSYRDVGAPNGMYRPSSFHDGSSDQTQASNPPTAPRGQSHGKDRPRCAVNTPTSNGSVENKSKQGGTTTGTGNKQVLDHFWQMGAILYLHCQFQFSSNL